MARHALPAILLTAAAMATLACAEEPASTEPAAAPDFTVPKEIVVLDFEGRPVPGVWIVPAFGHEGRFEAERLGRTTDANGRTLFYGSHGTRYPVVTGGVAPTTSIELGDMPTVLRLSGGIPLEVELVDLRTGGLVSEGAEVALIERYPDRSWSLARSGGRFTSPLSPLGRGAGDRGKLSLSVTAPEGLAALQSEEGTVEGAVSLFAERLRVRIPLHREAAVSLTVRDIRGRPVSGAWVSDAWIGHKYVAFGLGLDISGRDGALRVRGVPDLAGERLRVYAGDSRGRSWSSEEVSLDGAGTPHVAVAVPSRGPAPCYGSGCGSPETWVGPPGPGDSSLVVRVVRRNAAPAAEAQVRLEGPPEKGGAAAWRIERRTEADGSVSFDELPAGAAFLEIREPGFVWSRVPVELRPRVSAALHVDEPEGRSVRVLVRGDDGASLAGATVQIRPACGVAYAVVEDGVQLLGLVTDGKGECRIDHVPEGGARIFAQWGSRFEAVDLGPDATELEVVLPRRE